MTSSRNHLLDLYKLLLITVICFHHSHWFKGNLTSGYLVVEFFFIVSGYFIYCCHSKKQLRVSEFFMKKCGRLLPIYAITLTGYICLALTNPQFYRHPETANWPLSILNDGLMASATGLFYLGDDYVMRFNGPDWYLSALLWGGTLLYFIIRSCKHAPIIIATITIAVYAYLFGVNGGIESWKFAGPFYMPFWRGMAGMGLGILLGMASNAKITQQFLSKERTALRIIMLAVPTAIAAGCLFSPTNADLPGLIALFTISAALIYMPLPESAPKWLRYVPDISLEILLIHRFTIGMTNQISETAGFEDSFLIKSILLLLLTITGALLLQRVAMPAITKTTSSLRYAITSNLRNSTRL